MPELPVFSAAGRTRTLVVRPVANARRLSLRIDPRDATVRLTLPPRTSLRRALGWVETKRAWIEAQLASLPPDEAIGPGTVVPFEGGALPVLWAPDALRLPRRTADGLMVGGPPEMVAGRVLRWLRQEAARVLEDETRACAARAGVTVGRVGVGDARTRWGSCSAGGDIRYSWRLILVPPEVRRATVAHEVAHRLHMDHGARFHAAAARLFGGDPAPARDWLRRHGAAVQKFGRSS
jgi:predicted metal-dependent hydrolase